MGTRKDFKKTKYTGVYVKEDSSTKVKTYLVRIKMKGTETEQVVGYSNDKYKTNASLAFERRIKLMNKLKSGQSVKQSDNPTLESFYNEYLQLRKEVLTEDRFKGNLGFFNKHIPDALKKKRLKEISNAELQKIINKMILQKYKGSTIKRLKETLSPMYKKAIELGIVEKNPMVYLDFPSFDNTRYFELPKKEISALVHEIMNIPDKYYKLIYMFLLRGRRSNEVLSMCWEDVFLEEGYYLVRDKNNKIRKNQRYLFDNEILQQFAQLEEDTGLIFKSFKTGRKLSAVPKSIWKSIKKKVGLNGEAYFIDENGNKIYINPEMEIIQKQGEDCVLYEGAVYYIKKDVKMRIHDFRHLLGYISVNNNIPLESIQRALGHSRITTTQKYSNQKEEMAKTAADTYLDLIK